MIKNTTLASLTPLIAALLGAAALVLWLTGGPGSPIQERRPGTDRTEGSNSTAAAKWEGKLVKGPGAPSELPGAWPWFRGPNRDNISPDPTPLAKSWPEAGPNVLWKTSVGEGYAAPAIWKGRVYLMDYDQPAQADALRCLSLADGQEIWRYTYPVKVKRYHGMSRTIPAVSEKFLVALGPKCHVICLDPLSGELRWKLDLVREFNVSVPEWYAGQCPFLDGNRLILGTGGDGLVMAVDLETGKPVWKSPNPNDWQMTHSSIAALDFKGRRQYVYCGSGGVASVAAESGALLWDTPEWRVSIANVPTPVVIGDGRLFLCGGYNAGSMILQLQEAGGKFKAEPITRLKATVFGSTQQTPILCQNHLFGVRPDGQLVCLNLEGKTVWQSGPANRFGTGPYLIAQGMIYLMDDNGTLTLAEASPTGYKQLARAKIIDGHDAWGPFALAGGRLLARDMTQLVCVEVGGK